MTVDRVCCASVCARDPHADRCADGHSRTPRRATCRAPRSISMAARELALDADLADEVAKARRRHEEAARERAVGAVDQHDARRALMARPTRCPARQFTTPATIWVEGRHLQGPRRRRCRALVAGRGHVGREAAAQPRQHHHQRLVREGAPRRTARSTSARTRPSRPRTPVRRRRSKHPPIMPKKYLGAAARPRDRSSRPVRVRRSRRVAALAPRRAHRRRHDRRGKAGVGVRRRAVAPPARGPVLARGAPRLERTASRHDRPQRRRRARLVATTRVLVRRRSRCAARSASRTRSRWSRCRAPASAPPRISTSRSCRSDRPRPALRARLHRARDRRHARLARCSSKLGYDWR